MPQKLTKRFVESLQPREEPYEERDTEIRGFLVRVEPSGLRSFWHTYSFNGKRGNRVRLGAYPGHSVEGARALAKAAAGDVAKGIDPAARKKAEKAQLDRVRLSKLETFLDDRFEPWAAAHMKSGKEQLARIRSDFKDYLGKPLSALHPLTIEGLRQKWRKGGKQPATINRDIQRISSVLSRAVEMKVLMEHPLKGQMKPMKADRAGRVRFLSAAEEKSLRDALEARQERMREDRARFNEWRKARHQEPLPDHDDVVDHLKPLVLVALNTGMRRGELFSLDWADVDLTAGIVTVQAASAKSGQTRRIPLNAEATQVLTAWHKPGAQGRVFPGEGGARLTNITKSWGALVKDAKLTGFNFHDLRHTFASRLVQAGTDLNTVRTLLGHSEISTTLIYAHLGPDNLRAAVERVKVAG